MIRDVIRQIHLTGCSRQSRPAFCGVHCMISASSLTGSTASISLVFVPIVFFDFVLEASKSSSLMDRSSFLLSILVLLTSEPFRSRIFALEAKLVRSYKPRYSYGAKPCKLCCFHVRMMSSTHNNHLWFYTVVVLALRAEL